MKALSYLALVAALAAAPAAGTIGAVVQSFPSPGEFPNALAIGPTYLYVLCDSPTCIYRVDPDNGSVVSSYASPFGMTTRGLGYEYGGYLWVGNYSAPYPRIVRCREDTGSILSSFRVTQHEMFGGVACQGEPNKAGTFRAIISNAFAPEPVTRHSAAGSLLSSFEYPEWVVFFDPAWDYGNEIIWWGDRRPNGAYVFGYTVGGSLVASFPSPADDPYGCTYLDGYLWISTSARPNYIWKVVCPKDFKAVAPASLGRVKALFR